MLLRVTAYIRRFVHNCKANKTKELNCHKSCGPLTLIELEESKLFWLAKVQSIAFQAELIALKSGNSVHRRSCLKSFNPFLDQSNLIRVGGRFARAPISEKRFPIVLPAKSSITKLIFEYEHRRLLHIGPQGLLANIQINYWPVRGRNLARQTVHKCITCFRAKLSTLEPFMAPLPQERVTKARPFTNSSVDFCGPIMIRSGLIRIVPLKHYIAVFVCMVTRAIHLELVRDLSFEAFLAALFRFISRRGQCTKLFSDNGTNFVGANKVLQTWLNNLKHEQLFQDQLTTMGINWRFIPPSAPHFGGIWEAAVKSTKQHLIKLTKGALINYEEMSTLLCRIEAVLNSRPLTNISSDPSDYSVLTPGHFLVGGPLTSPPEPDFSNVPQSRLRRFSLMQSRLQMLWKRWSLEYLSQLHRRGRWTTLTKNLAIGDLTILRDDTAPIMKWRLVRVTETHPGPDGIVRVVCVRNSAGNEFRRPFIKLSLLPSPDEDIEDFDNLNNS